MAWCRLQAKHADPVPAMGAGPSAEADSSLSGPGGLSGGANVAQEVGHFGHDVSAW